MILIGALYGCKCAKNEDKFEFECTVARHESEGEKCITELFLKGSCENQVMFKNQCFICVMFKYRGKHISLHFPLPAL